MCIRPGAMHIITSFLGCIGTLMKGSGMDVLVGAAFGSMNEIITGVAWVRAMRAFRMELAALLQNCIRTGAKTCEKMSAYMEEARKHPTGRYWVDNFLKPTVLTHQFIRAEREGNWLIQQLCFERMLPYLYSAGQFHYARYIPWHLQDIRYLLPPEAKADQLAGAHVCRHREGYWKGGLKGITLTGAGH